MPKNRFEASKNAVREVLVKLTTVPVDQAICTAASRGELDSVRKAHQLGASLRAHDDEPLCEACAGGHIEVIRYLNENGVPPKRA